MYARATTTVTILRGVEEDGWGDLVDSDTPVATGIPASIIESKTYFKGEITTQPRNMRYAKMRLTRKTDIRTNDRVKDERSGEIWIIQNISKVQNPAIGQDLRVDLQFVGGDI